MRFAIVASSSRRVARAPALPLALAMVAARRAVRPRVASPSRRRRAFARARDAREAVAGRPASAASRVARRAMRRARARARIVARAVPVAPPPGRRAAVRASPDARDARARSRARTARARRRLARATTP